MIVYGILSQRDPGSGGPRLSEDVCNGVYRENGENALRRDMTTEGVDNGEHPRTNNVV